MKSHQPNDPEIMSKAVAHQPAVMPSAGAVAPPAFKVTSVAQKKEDTVETEETEIRESGRKFAGAEGAGEEAPKGPVSLQISQNVIQASSFRFDEDPVLIQVAAGTRTLTRGDRGMAVRIVQQGLSDSGIPLPAGGVDGSYEAGTETAVKAFQTSKSLPDTGNVDAATLNSLDADHDLATTRPEIRMATAHTAANPLAGTRSISREERRAFQQAINTEPTTSTGAQPTFQPTIAAGNYQTRIQDALTHFIDNAHAEFVTAQTRRTQPGGLEAWTQIEAVAQAAKRVTDSVFGTYRTGPAFRQGVNLSDAWEQETTHIAADPSYADFIAADVLDAFLGYHPIASEPGAPPGINEEHGAVPSRSQEAGIINTVKRHFLTTRKQDLLDIQINWPGLAEGGSIAIQRTTSTDNAVNRDRMWDLFSTCIHEYIHTLEHPNHVRHRGHFSEHRGDRTLREGSTDYFTAIVWNSLNFTPALRLEVEGPYHNAAVPHPIHPHGRYGETANAARAAGIVGFHNMAAAFFLGRVRLIG